MSTKSSAQLFIIQASHPRAHRNVELSIASAIDPDLCARHFKPELLEQVRAQSKDGQFYAWGAVPGPGNLRTWRVLEPGDYVLILQKGKYTFVSRVISKHRNPDFARDLWGTREENKTWELMYFLQPPTRTHVSTTDLDDVIPATGAYRGFTLVSPTRVSHIRSQYGSLQDFVVQRLMVAKERVGEVAELPRVSEVISPEEARIDPSKLDHWDAMAILLDLGNIRGHDTYTSDPARKSSIFGRPLGDIAQLVDIPTFTHPRYLATVKNVDVIWFKEEFPSYCFEVEHTTGVTRGLLRLYQIRVFSQARFFIISPASILSRFKSETEKDPFYKIKDRYNFRSYGDLVLFYEEAKRYHRAERDFLG